MQLHRILHNVLTIIQHACVTQSTEYTRTVLSQGERRDAAVNFFLRDQRAN